MTTYRVEPPVDLDDGIRVVCEEHGNSEMFDPGYRTVTFHCPDCEVELGVSLENLGDWRDLGEMC